MLSFLSKLHSCFFFPFSVFLVLSFSFHFQDGELNKQCWCYKRIKAEKNKIFNEKTFCCHERLTYFMLRSCLLTVVIRYVLQNGNCLCAAVEKMWSISYLLPLLLLLPLSICLSVYFIAFIATLLSSPAHVLFTFIRANTRYRGKLWLEK